MRPFSSPSQIEFMNNKQQPNHLLNNANKAIFSSKDRDGIHPFVPHCARFQHSIMRAKVARRGGYKKRFRATREMRPGLNITHTALFSADRGKNPRDGGLGIFVCAAATLYCYFRCMS
jgi:hypothetical protein